MRNFITHNWFTVFSVLGLLFVVIAKHLNGLRFTDFLSLIGSSKYFKIFGKEPAFLDLFDGFLFANLTLSMSTFIYLGYDTFVTPLLFDLNVLLKIILVVGVLIIARLALERILGKWFEIDEFINTYLFLKTAFYNYTGLIFWISNIFILYSGMHGKVIIITTVIVICIIHLIGFVISFKMHQKLIFSNFFYFFLYLCALKFGPYVILYKALRDHNI